MLLNCQSLNRETTADLMDVQDSVDLDDYGSPSSSSSSAASLYSVMSTLYCLSIAADFRKPVEVLYPNIATSYLSVIKNPMDLGTLLLECMKGNATVNSIRQGLRLVFSNSLLFNAGSPMMEAISQHLESFASGLFEEATRLPFNEKKPLLRDFNEELVYRRSYRLNSVCRIPLKDVEVRCIENVLLAIQDKLPMELEEAMANMMETILKYYNSVGSQEHSDEIAPILTLELIFNPFLEATRAPHPMLLTEETEGCTVLPSLVGLLGLPIGIERTHTRTHSLPLQLQPMTSIPISHMSSNDMRQLTSAPSLTSLSKMELNMMPVDCLLSVDMIGARTAESEQNQDQILHLSNLPLNPTMPHTHNSISNVSASAKNGDNSNDNNFSSSSSSGGGGGSCSNKISDNINGNRNGNGNTMNTQKHSYSPILPSTLPYLTALDDQLGSLCVRLEERLLRGTNHSSVWQRPLALMWAQPAKVRTCSSIALILLLMFIDTLALFSSSSFCFPLHALLCTCSYSFASAFHYMHFYVLALILLLLLSITCTSMYLLLFFCFCFPLHALLCTCSYSSASAFHYMHFYVLALILLLLLSITCTYMYLLLFFCFCFPLHALLCTCSYSFASAFQFFYFHLCTCSYSFASAFQFFYFHLCSYISLYVI